LKNKRASIIHGEKRREAAYDPNPNANTACTILHRYVYEIQATAWPEVAGVLGKTGVRLTPSLGRFESSTMQSDSLFFFCVNHEVDLKRTSNSKLDLI
jgi:hypothetical protein